MFHSEIDTDTPSISPMVFAFLIATIGLPIDVFKLETSGHAL
jgi:hypothetical protein